MNDPIINLLVLLSVRYRWTILACALICTAAGAAMGSVRPKGFIGNAFVQPVTITDGRPAQPIKGTRTWVAEHLERMKLEQKLSANISTEVKIVKNGPPAVVDLPLLELIARSDDKEQIARALKMGIKLMKEQDALYEEERDLRKSQIATLQADLVGLHKLPLIPSVQDSKIRLILELSELVRGLSPARVHPVRVLQAPRIKTYRAPPPLAVFALGGLLFGLFVGYLSAFFIAGARALNKR